MEVSHSHWVSPQVWKLQLALLDRLRFCEQPIAVTVTRYSTSLRDTDLAEKVESTSLSFQLSDELCVTMQATRTKCKSY